MLTFGYAEIQTKQRQTLLPYLWLNYGLGWEVPTSDSAPFSSKFPAVAEFWGKKRADGSKVTSASCEK